MTTAIELDSVREAVREVIDDNPAKLKADRIAAILGVSRSEVYAWGEVERKTIPLGRLVQLVSLTKDYRPVAAVCRAVGGIFVALPAQSDFAAEYELVAAIKEFSDVMQEVSAALADGTITGAEIARVRKQGAEAQRALAQLLAAMEARAK